MLGTWPVPVLKLGGTMAKMSAGTFSDFKDLNESIAGYPRKACFEEIAKHFVSSIYSSYAESVVLARLFATVPYGELPVPNRVVVDALTQSKGVKHLLKEETPVLSLVATNGAQLEWNDRRRSKGHVGIPLVSAAFIEAIPMMSRLLKQLGNDLSWIDSNDTSLVTKTVGNLSGVFYVADAKKEVDQKGRKVIAAQDFVAANKVETVFGFGGRYIGQRVFFVTILFLNERLSRAKAEEFAAALSSFKTVSSESIRKGVFA